MEPELPLLGVAEPDANHALGLQAVAHELGQPVQDLAEVERAGEQTTGLDHALSLGRPAHRPLVQPRVLDRDGDLIRDNLQ